MTARAILHSIYSSSTTNQTSASDQTRNLIKKESVSASSDSKLRQKPNLKASSVARTLNSYVEIGQMVKALTLFQTLKNPKNFHWNVMIRGYTNNGQYEEAINFYYQMQNAGNLADNFTFPSVIKSCTKSLSLSQGLTIHGQIVKLGLPSDIYICNSLIAMYSKLGLLESAERLFIEMPIRETVSWNAMMEGYVSNGEGLKSLSLFRKLQEDFGVKSDELGVLSALEACCLESLPKKGKEIHCHIIRQCFELEIKVLTTLLDMYCNCGEIVYAERLFSLMPKENVVAWNVMINGYVLSNQHEMAFASFMKMQESDIEQNAITMVNLLPSLTQLRTLSHGKSVHGAAIRRGLLPHLFLETALNVMYAKNGELRSAKLLFDEMPEKSLVAWNVMISAYVQNEKNLEAIDIFLRLLMEQPLLKPDAFTISSIVPAYSELTSLPHGKQIHGYVFKLGYESNTLIQNSIIYMYARCGDLRDSRKVFDKMLCRDVVTWNTIILAYAFHGLGNNALDMFSDMKKLGFEPNESTFLSVLSACSVCGFIDKGWMYFDIMQKEHKVNPQIEHYGCLVDLLGRSGDLEKALQLIETMPVVPTSRIWGSLLTASRYNNNIQVAEVAAKRIFDIDHDNTGCYVILYGLYAGAGRWEDAERVRSLMKENGLQRTRGMSFVELNCKTSSFAAGDRSHNEIDTIQLVLDILSMQIGENATTLVTRFNPQDIVTMKANLPCRHSVRLAVSFGLISSALGTPVLVKKNIRICNDCHSAIKKISSFTGREIVVGDSSIYHHFNNGLCCCGDYW
ncbi:pentatricopeptide repeat-containing protein At4g35130, chloroplastic [Dendrobium catenatum]|uniref:Pentatricopeptide repeat-containing protein n=1 Tax=Dendrobium catenatum TaxID=906689 RepID=A0A2I0VJ37_9ASPA|nr:pentatricopeptide repeat-containing protein At4g35130, chloroplastic [Dendrobium catenatum]PKU63430.1 Pentatricopeptide repeat-containing protein [Dendrobium catenatum]